MTSPFWEKARHADRKLFLDARARIAAAVRRWFADEGFTEVEPSALAFSPGAEVHVDAFAADGRFLHTSPEFAMKKLLAAGEEKIFFLGKCWRRGETGPLHAEEFTMLEWYRAGAPYQHVMDDCVALARLAAAETQSPLRWKDRVCDPNAKAEKLTVRDALRRHAGVLEDLSHDAFAATIVRVEPQLGSPTLTLLHDYPLSEAALAQRTQHDPSVAERFEMYACGVELANGFGELSDPVEQRARLVADMAEKQKRYGKTWPIDEDFLAALAHMPPASGVALGFDRLVMLATGARHIRDVLWTP
ncbi:EF-P lysine aminoacylase EpmA [Terricaulis sp.]|uniref:EF-P lysine aminoacylase EpmA n=1 Tax=Terricaulis sp. TaxID=2768686 RepID=UPI003784F3E0